MDQILKGSEDLLLLRLTSLITFNYCPGGILTASLPMVEEPTVSSLDMTKNGPLLATKQHSSPQEAPNIQTRSFDEGYSPVCYG